MRLTQLYFNRKSRTQVYYYFITSSDWFPIPIKSVVKSNLTAWCDQNLSNCALNALTVLVFTTEFGKLFQIFSMHAEKKFFFVNHNEIYG